MKHQSEKNADEKAMQNRIVHLESVMSQILDDLASARDITEDYEYNATHSVVVLLHDAEELAKEALKQ